MATLTLKNVPDDLYQRLKREAALHRRSLNQEVIAQLEERSPRLADAPWERASTTRATMPVIDVTEDELRALIREGRK